MEYRWETTSMTGFVQQLACNYLPHGYWFYVSGRVPEGKSIAATDQKLMQKYQVAMNRGQRARRKKAGHANLHYLRYERDWLIVATHGTHQFFLEEGEAVKDVRKHPIHFAGYSLTVRRGEFLKKELGEAIAETDGKYRVRVQIAREQLRVLKPYLIELSTKRSSEWLSRGLWNLPFEPYAPVRKQLLSILRVVNSRRQGVGQSKISPSALRMKRLIVKPFGDEDAQLAIVAFDGTQSEFKSST